MFAGDAEDDEKWSERIGWSRTDFLQVLRCITSYMSRKFGLLPGIALLEVEHREEVSMDGEDESTEVSKWAKKKRRMRSDVPVVKNYSAIATTVQCESSSGGCDLCTAQITALVREY